MVSFTLDAVKFLLIYRHLQNTYWFKCGVDFVYLIEGSDKAQAKINDAIPYT